MMRNFVAAIAGLLAILQMACSDPTFNPPTVSAADQWDYFPLRIGQQTTWRVDSIVYDFATGGGTVRDSSVTFVQEIVSDTLRDQTGELNYVIDRFERLNDSAPWQFVRRETAVRNASQAIRTEQNLRFLKLIFPMTRRSEWNGNIWIDVNREIEIAGERIRPFVNWQYEVDSIDVAATVGAFQFDSTLLVTEVNESNIIERRLSQTRYAKGVGMVEREIWILDSQYCNQDPVPTDCTTLSWDLKAERGYRLRQVILDY
ncbi:MAG: hypothetical protein IT269_12080 [Saprospiraceae bacterium]|nr:hypothetical protein [Saprospiraceae bacterium]